MHAQQQRRRRQLMSTMHDKKLIAAFTLTSPSLCKCTIFIKIVSPTHKHTHFAPICAPATPLFAHTRPLNTAHRAAVAAIVCANAQRKRDTSIL